MTNSELKNLILNTRKVLNVKGLIGRKPNAGSKCNVTLKIVSVKTDFQSTLIPFEIDAHGAETTIIWVIGDGITLLDRLVEYCISQLSIKETSAFYVNTDTLKLHMEIILNEYHNGAYIFELSEDERLSLAKKYKEVGVTLFQENRISEAFYKFSQALKVILPLGSPAEVFQLRSHLYNNMANCQMLFKNAEFCIQLCNKSLNIEANAKAYYRRALAYIQLKLYDKAEEDLKQVLEMDATNKAAIARLKEVRFLDKDNRDNYKKTVQRMFQ